MAWDFSTEPEFQQQLDWMRAFVREEIWPVETIFGDLDDDAFRRADRAAAGAGPRARAVGGAPGPRARRPGLRPGQARPDARDPRHDAVRARSCSATRRRTRATRRSSRWPAREDQKQQWLHPLLAGDLKSAFSMTEPHTAGSDPTLLETSRGARRRRLGHQRPQVVLLQRVGGGLPDRHGGHRPRGAQVPARVDADRARRHAGREDPARHPDDGAPVRALRPLRRALRDRLRGRARARPTRCSARAAPAS